MTGTATVTAEVWAVGADATGLWHLPGIDALRYGPIAQDHPVQFEVDTLLDDAEIPPAYRRVVHGTSWRPSGPTVILTHIAVVSAPGAVLDRWPAAAPLGADLLAAVGRPPTHAATAVPTAVRRIDVLVHALRHVAFLREHDAGIAAALDATWRRHLAPLAPALAGLYSDVHPGAA
jgi:hypothetical protein